MPDIELNVMKSVSNMSETVNIRIECEPLQDLEKLADRWRSLERIADASPFISWLWISSWLRLREQWPNARVVSAWRDSRLVGIVLLFKNTTKRAKLIPVESIYINESGDPSLDMIIEHNGFLMDPEFERITARAMCEYIEHHVAQVDEVYISGVSNTSATFEYLRDGAWEWKIDRQSKGWFVDLKSLRLREIPFIASLSKKRRYQIRRSIKAFEKHGRIQVECAKGVALAKSWLEELKELHRVYWESKGRRGAFSWKEREDFYCRLVEYGIPSGAVDLIRVKAGDTTVGILFNLCDSGIVYYLQSGFDYSVEPAHQPGNVTISLAIQWYADQGADRFDFLAGGEAHKSILADDSYVLLWGAAQRKNIKFLFVDVLRGLKDSLSRFSSRMMLSTK